MRWYQGGISEAITVSKRKGAVFVVYIEGKDESSASFTESVNSDVVSKKLETESFVAIKLEGNSVAHKQFAEIYKQAVVPSIFFIGKTGIPLEIIKEVQDSSTLAQTIEKVLEKSGIVSTNKQTQSFIQSEKLDSSSSAATTSQPQTETAVEAKPENAEQSVGDNIVCENGVCYKKTSEASSTLDSSVKEVSSNEDLSAEEKIERAKQLVEKLRLEKEKKEEEKEKQKEIERREMGKNVQNMKRLQEDQELKQLKEEREKEKRENQAARDRVLAQIAQDKAERAVKFSNSPPKTDQQPSTSSRTPPEKKVVNSNISKLQFKLPDGITHTHEFQSSDTLEKVRAYVQTTLNMSNNFTLSTSFPRREFTTNDNSQSLLDLELVPNAVLLVLRPSSGPVAHGGSGGLVGMFWFLLTPVITILNYFKNWLGFDGHRSNSESNKRPADNSDGFSRSQPKRPRDTTVVRKQGNVHRLTDKGDSDDENNTWNGNSTQQM